MNVKETDFIWFNGQINQVKDCNITLFTHGLHYGTSIFEGARIYNGKIFKLYEHIVRFINSGKLADVPLKYSIEELVDVSKEIVKKNNLVNGYFRPLAWRGDETLGIVSTNNTVNVMVACWPWGSYYDENKIKHGIRLCGTDFVKPDPRSTCCNAKIGGFYHIASIVKNKISLEGYDDALFFDTQGFVAETTSSNIFFIKNNELHTPIADCFLNGITRQTVIEIAKKLNIKCYERKILPSELNTFDEAFVTGSAAEVMPIGEIFNHKYKVDLSLKIRKEYIEFCNNYQY